MLNNSLTNSPEFQGLDFSKIKAVFVDADDTLWENNLFFLQCEEWICITGRSLGFTDKAVVEIMNRNERRNISIFGYGYDCFERSLIQTLRRLTSASGQTHRFAPLAAKARRWTAFLRQHPIIFLPGVGNVLPKLAKQFPTYIVTKGDQNDQMAKVHRSGLLPHIHGAEVVPHKFQSNYRELLGKLGLEPHEAVMIGNSPASDINNPKRIGMQTIFIPHKKTWTMEQEPILPGFPETIHVPHFGALLDLFKLPL